ncbi:unnamed protein product [Soboliphyme baturini]|uniref:Transposase n=1 Tax=Soboliphyme baturini TaxID=241478 RepID=A0A183IVM5_9BILA|nr:unnamed protein product [Soboliphyme baturini]
MEWIHCKKNRLSLNPWLNAGWSVRGTSPGDSGGGSQQISDAELNHIREVLMRAEEIQLVEQIRIRYVSISTSTYR